MPGLEDVFQDGVHLAWFKDAEECLDKVAYYLKHEDERRRIAAAGHELVQRRHRYQDRVANILEVLRGGLSADTHTGPALQRAEELGR